MNNLVYINYNYNMLTLQYDCLPDIFFVCVSSSPISENV